MAKEEAGLSQLCFGAGGVYLAFVYYGSMQEDVTTFTNPETGEKFKFAWFLQVCEAFANVVLGSICMLAIDGYRPGVPQKQYVSSGALQVSAKYFTTAAMVYGVSFPVATLAKSSKMIPVMVGQLLSGKVSYSLREYLHVAAIVAGTVLVSGGKSSGPPSSAIGLLCLALSLSCDGFVGNQQKLLKAALEEAGLKERNFEMQVYTNVYMMITAIVLCTCFGEFGPAISFLAANPSLYAVIIKFGLCSAFGQAFIFYLISTFDPLKCTTVTTTRKVFSVVWSIVTKGHKLSGMGWSGIALAFGGILGELEQKVTESRHKAAKKAAAAADSHVSHYAGLSANKA